MKRLIIITLCVFYSLLSTAQFTSSNLALVSINTSGTSIQSDTKIPCYIRIIYNGYNSSNQLSDSANVYSGYAKIKIRGASSLGYPQKSYSFTTTTQVGTDLNTELLGMPSEHDWVLLNTWNDKAFCRNLISQHIFEKMGHYGVRLKLCEVILNGSYNGVYLLGEKIKRDSNRVDIAKLTMADVSGLEVTGGYIIKNDIYNGSNGWLSNYHPVGQPGKNVYPLYEYPEADDILAAQKTYIQKFVDSMETALYGDDFANPVLGYNKYISIKTFIDYFLVNELARNVDGNKKSSYWHKDKGGPLKAGPVWDFDWAWKNIQDCAEFQNTDGSGWSYKIVDCSADVTSFGWFKRLLEDPNYTNRTNCRWKELRQTILDTTYLFHFIDSIATDVNQAQSRHFTTFPTLGTNNGAPQVDAIPNTFSGEINKLKQWIRVRVAWLDTNMPGDCEVLSTVSSENKKEMLSAYPNPSSGSFTLKGLQHGSTIELYNTTGQLIHTQAATATELKLDLNLQPGIYILRNGKERLVISRLVY